MPVPGTDPGPFLSALGWAGDVGQIPLQVLRGRPGAAGRKLVDVLGDIPDALLPGDWIPHIGDEDANVRPSELVGVDPSAHPGIAKAVDIVGGAALNPLSYVGIRGGTIKAGLPLSEGVAVPGATGLIEKGKDALGAAYAKLPEGIRETTANTLGKIRRTANWLDIPDEGQALVNQAQGAGQQASRVAQERVRQIYANLTPTEQEAVGEIAHGIQRNGGNRADWRTLEDADAYLASRPDVRPDAVKKAVAERQGLMDQMAQEGADAGVFTPGLDRGDYIQRHFSGDYFKDIEAPAFVPKAGGVPQAIKGRKLDTREDVLKFLQETPEADLDFNALTSDARRAAQQGKLVEKAQVGKRLTGNEDFTLSDPEMRGQVDTAISAIAKDNPDYAYRLQNMWRGMPPRGDDWFSKGLHGSNLLFKKAATAGVLLPRIGFSVRNRIGGLWQALSNDQARGTLGSTSKRALGDLLGAVDDGFVKLTGSRRIKPTELTGALDHIDQSYQQAGGSVAKFRELLGQHKDGQYLTEALDNGVLENFVSSEDLLSEMARTPGKEKLMNLMDWPLSIARGVETRMRLGSYLDLRKSGIAKDAPDAARTIRDTYLDYANVSPENRTLRSWFPFAAFATQSAKQQAGFVARHPVALTATAPLFNDDDGLPKFDWLNNRMSFPVGLDEDKNPQYISGLGLPIESLTQIPGLSGADFYSDFVGQLQPLVKSGVSYAANRDPLTGRSFGQFDQLFGEHMGEFGRVANVIKGTGLAQPLSAPFDTASNLADSRKSLGERALQATTGVRFTSVDPELAKRQKIENYLQSDPGVKSYQSFYQEKGSEDPGLTDLLSQLNESKARLKDKRKSAASVL